MLIMLENYTLTERFVVPPDADELPLAALLRFFPLFDYENKVKSFRCYEKEKFLMVEILNYCTCRLANSQLGWQTFSFSASSTAVVA